MAQIGTNLVLPPGAIAQEMKRFEGNNFAGAVSSFIPQIPSGLNPIIPIQTSDFAYSIQNDYNGYLPHIEERYAPLPEMRQFNLNPYTFNIQTTIHQYDQFEERTMQQLFATSSTMPTQSSLTKATAQTFQNYIVEALSKQSIARNEGLVYNLITDTNQYTVANTDSIVAAIPSWTITEGGELLQKIAEGADYLNKFTGNGLLTTENANEAPEVSSDYELIIVLPRKIYNQFVGVWGTVFAGNQTLMGYDGKSNVGGAFRGMTPQLFASVTGFYGAKVVCSQTYFNNSIVNQLETTSDNFVSFWDQEESIFMFTTSNDLYKPASIIKPTYRPDTMYESMFLGASYIQTTGTYDYISPLLGNFYKIDLALS